MTKREMNEKEREEDLCLRLCGYLGLKVETAYAGFNEIKVFPPEDPFRYLTYRPWKEFLCGCPGRLSVFELPILPYWPESETWNKIRKLMTSFPRVSSLDELEMQLSVSGF